MISFARAILFFLAPILLWGFYKARVTRREMASAEREPRPFAPEAIVAPSGWWRSLAAGEWAQTLHLKTALRTFYLLGSWLFFVILSISLWEFDALRHTTWTDPSATAWFFYLLGATHVIGMPIGMISMATAMMTVAPLRFAPTALFFRTRPVSLGFQFWSRVGVTLGTLLATIVTGAAASLVLLILRHGLVWLHLPPSFPGMLTDGDNRPELYHDLLLTSAPRVLLSLCTTTTLLFSLSVAIFVTPVDWPGKKSNQAGAAISLWLGMLAVFFAGGMISLNTLHLPEQLFFYGQLGAPPPYLDAVYPVLAAAGCLGLARWFVSRIEV